MGYMNKFRPYQHQRFPNVFYSEKLESAIASREERHVLALERIAAALESLVAQRVEHVLRLGDSLVDAIVDKDQP